MARTSRVWAPAFALRCASEGAEKADPERHGEKFFSAACLLTWISSWFLFSFCAPTSPAAAPVQAPRAGVSPRRGRAFTTWRVLCFGLSWLVVLLLLSPSAPCPPPAFSSLLVLFSPFFRWLDPPPVSDSLAGFRDPARFLWEDAPAAAEEDAMHGGFREAGRRGWRARLQRRGEPAFAAVAFAPHKRRAPAACLQCFQGAEERGPPASWKSLTFSFLPRATFSVAIERDKFKLSCTQASFCHRYLHWVDLIAKKLPRASASAPPLYSVDVRSLPSRGAARNAEEKTNKGQGQSQEEERDGADSGSRGDEERSHEERSGDSVPTSFVGEKVEVKEKKKEKKEKKEKEKEDEKTKEKKHESKKGGTEKKKRTGISRSPATVVAFDVVRGSDGLRLEARLAVFVDGIVRLKMREKLNAQQLQREKEKTEGKRAEAPNEPQDVHANVFRLDERFRRYEGYVADVLHLEEDPAEGTEDEAKVTFSTNATVVEFVARPPMSGGHRGEFPRFFPAKMRAAEASCPPTPTVSETSPEKASSEKASEPEPRPAAALKTLEARQSARAFAWHLDGERLLVRVVLQHSPFALRVYLHNKLTQEINEKQLLNWEAFLPVNSKKRGAAEAEGRQQVEERMHMDAGDAVPNALANTRSQVPEELQAAEAARVAEAATGAGVDLREKIKGLRGLEWSVGEVLGENVDEEREVVNDIIMPLFHAGAIHDAVDLYRQGAMEEAFDRFLDSKPFGPTAIGVDVTFWGANQVYGLFEHAAPFPLKSYTEPYRLYNLDVFNYELDSPFSMYASIPFLMAIHAPAASKEVGLRRGSTSRFFEEPENVPQRRGSCGGAAFASREEELRTKSPLVTGFLFLNPTEMWVKLRYDQGGEDLPETFAGLNEEEDEDGSDSVSKRQKRSRQRKYQSFASMESMDWEAFQQKRKKTKYEALRTWWTAEGGIFDAIMFLGPTPQDVHRQYHIATGMPAMAPLFALGKHQCRWNYNDQEDVLTVDRGFDEHNIPYDVLWIDIEHTLEKRYFTWDPKTFPEPQKMIESIASKDRKVVAIVDPHLKAVADYYVYREALEGSMLVRNPSGGIFHGHCWSGDSAYADFLSPRTREWWRGLYSYDRYKFSTPDLWVWNDMNEPSVFSGPELSMPKDLLHMGGLLEHREIHNLYGHYHHRSTYEGLMRRGEGNQRPFLLTRSLFVGSHRFGFVWTGDNRAEWTHLAASIPMILSAAVCGVSAIGADVDGFFADTSEELHIRWQQAGIFYPFYRSHAHMDTKRREPWLFSKRSLDVVREAVLVRYRLLPYWYTLFAEYALTGDPIVRPLWWLDALSPHFQEEQQAFLVGSDFLVRPIVRPMDDDQVNGFELDIALPRDDNNVWIDYFSGLPFFPTLSDEPWVKYGVTLRNIPVFVRGGTILLTKERVKRSSTNMFHSPYTVHIYPSAAAEGAPGGGVATGRVYVDDYNSFEYLRGKFVYEGFAYFPKARDNEARDARTKDEDSESTWILRSEALPLEILDSNDEPLTGYLSDFPHREIERIVLWAVESPPTRVVVRRESPLRVEEAPDKLAEEEVEGEKEEELFFSSEEIVAPHHETQTQLLGGKTFFRVNVKLPKIDVGKNDWQVLFHF